MKKLLITMALVLVLTPSAFAKDFVDYGKSTKTGGQCHSAKCELVYSQDFTCLMDDANYNALTSCKPLTARYKETNAMRKALIERIKLILSAK